MRDEKARMAAALKRFSLTSPVLGRGARRPREAATGEIGAARYGFGFYAPKPGEARHAGCNKNVTDAPLLGERGARFEKR